MLWESSIYKFRVPADTGEQENGQLKEIAIDVTLSAPPFKEPGAVLEGVFEEVFDYLGAKRELKILDFGAAKLRNTVYLLEQGFEVHAVEFEKQLNEPGQAREMQEKARGFKKKFGELVFPNAFINSNERFDLVLLINVLSTMPVPAERLLVLQHCHEKLREGGHLFCYSMHGDAYYRENCTEEVRIGDGYYMNKGKFKSFFREFEDFEEDFMFLSSGFELAQKFPVKNNHARLYRKNPVNLLAGAIPQSDLEKLAELGKSIEEPANVAPKLVNREKGIQPIIPNPDKLSLDSLWLNKLKQITPGKAGAAEFHRLATQMIRRIFEPEFTEFTFNERTQSGRSLAELTAWDRSKEGLFAWLKNSTTVIPQKGALILMECRNYTYVDSSEVSKFWERLSELDRNFGFLIYRGTNRAKLLKQCRNYTEDNKYILPLVESDIIKLFRLRQENANLDIGKFLDDRFKELISKSGTRAAKANGEPPSAEPARQKKREPSIFVSYCHKDEAQKDDLLVQLGVLQSAELMSIWSDNRIGAGADWEQEIEKAMKRATVAILLITANFLTSSFILQREVPTLLNRRQDEGLHVIPLLARACAWKQIDWLREIQIRPKNNLSIWREEGRYADEELAVIVDEIATIIKNK